MAIGFEAVATAATVFAEEDGFDADTIERAVDYARADLDAGEETITVQLTGDEATIDDAIDAYRQFTIREIARTGQTALARGAAKTSIVPDHMKPDADPDADADEN